MAGHRLLAMRREASPREMPPLIQLNNRWRVASDRRQWVLELRHGTETPRAEVSGRIRSPWRRRAFCRTCAVLLRCISAHYRPVDVQALAAVRQRPQRHPSEQPR